MSEEVGQPPDADPEGAAAREPQPRDSWWRQWLMSAYRRAGADPAAPPGYDGRWPTSGQAFLWDLLPEDLAPGQDGVVAPTWTAPSWVEAVPEDQLPEAVAHERERHRSQQAAVTTVEGKASRLLTPTIALLAATVALTAFEIRAAGQASTGSGRLLPLFGAASAAVAVVWLFVAVVRALDADTRMGVYGGATTETLLKGPRAVLVAEVLAAERASWVRVQKANRLMQARVAVSRAVLALVLALLLAAVTAGTRTSQPMPAGISSPKQTKPEPSRAPTRSLSPSASQFRTSGS